mmetsp:Transcript_18994/g.32908  ORF Transcript_18994/g.32908 Transcript_18994/m.32908 type:complete len:169 (-) Transcript_18994:1342-1848(-)
MKNNKTDEKRTKERETTKNRENQDKTRKRDERDESEREMMKNDETKRKTTKLTKPREKDESSLFLDLFPSSTCPQKQEQTDKTILFFIQELKRSPVTKISKQDTGRKISYPESTVNLTYSLLLINKVITCGFSLLITLLYVSDVFLKLMFIFSSIFSRYNHLFETSDI